MVTPCHRQIDCINSLLLHFFWSAQKMVSQDPLQSLARSADPAPVERRAFSNERQEMGTWADTSNAIARHHTLIFKRCCFLYAFKWSWNTWDNLFLHKCLISCWIKWKWQWSHLCGFLPELGQWANIRSPIWQVLGRETLDKDIGSTTTTHITMKHFLPYKRDDGPGWDIIHRKTDYFQNIALRIFWKCPLKLNQPKI